MQDVVWICTNYSNQQIEGQVEGKQLFRRYVDEIISKVCDEPDEYLKIANSLHNNLQRKCEQWKQSYLLLVLKNKWHRNNTESLQLCIASA